jgi:hypothetical protein
MSESAADAPCPDGHPDTQRLLSIAGMTGVAAAPRASGASNASGGCCGGGCCGGG